MEISRLPNENEEQFIFRIGQLKDQGLISESWDEIADIINTEFKKDWTQYKKGKTYAKIYSEVRNFYNAGVFDSENTDVQKLQELKELQKQENNKNIEDNKNLNKMDTANKSNMSNPGERNLGLYKTTTTAVKPIPMS